MIRVYFHPTCASSYKLIRYIMERNISVKLVDTSSPATAIKRGILSVPWIEVGGEPAATDPIEPEELDLMLSGRYSPKIEPMEAFQRSLLASSYLSSVSLAHGRVDVGVTTAFLKAALRSVYSGISARELLLSIKKDAQSIYEALENKIARSVAMSFVREIYWTYGAQEGLDMILDERLFELWLISKISIGRAGIPGTPPNVSRKGVSAVMSLLGSDKDRMMKRVAEEQERIIKDLEYLNYVKKVTRRIY